nr:meiosis-specific kinetochore protein isoform X2 [Oryctolagus cuniculus]
MWPLRVYTRKKRAGQRLNVTPTPDLGAPAKTEAPPGPGPGLACRRKGKGKLRGLQKIAEKAEGSPRGGSGAGLPSAQLRVTGEQSLQEDSPREQTQAAKTAALGESLTDDLQVDSSSSSSELMSALNLQHDSSSSLLSCSVTESYEECKSFEESLSSFSSPELFRGSDYLVWERPKVEEHMLCKNSTLLDTSNAVAIEKMPHFSELSAILGTSSEDYQKCCIKKGMMLADQSIPSKPKYTSDSKSDNAACEVLLAEKTCPSSSEKAKKKPEKDSEHKDTNFQTKLNSPHVEIKDSSSCPSSTLESNAGRSLTKVLLPQPLESALKINSSTTDKKSTDLLTSTPSSATAVFVIDLSSVQKASSEELCPNVSNYVNSNEIVPVSSLQENSSNEFPSNTSEMCCIIRASPGTRQVKSKGITVKKKKYSPPKDIPQDIITKTNRKT